MGKISLDLSSIKAAGVYTIEIDNSTRSTSTSNALRLAVGFSNKGPFNRPVLLQQDSDRTSIFGEVDPKLEHKGCFFNRMLRTLISNGPVLALNLLKVDDSYNGPDQVNYAAMSLNAGAPNPKVATNAKYGEYDYVGDTTDKTVYGTSKGDVIPYIGNTPFASLYNRSRFWTPDKELLTAAAAKGLETFDYTEGMGSYEHTNLLNFANVGTEEISVLVFKPENITGYGVTAASWYGGEQNIPYGWIRPGDYISDYFILVVCVKGNWSNYPVLAQDPIWSSYFESTGIIKNKINNFISAEGITLLGSWSGIIIPDFINKQGDNISIERKINAATETTGLLMSFNEDAAHVISYDYTGIGEDEDASNPAPGGWCYDIDGDSESDDTINEAPYIVDMVGHEVFRNKVVEDTVLIDYEYNSVGTDAPVLYKTDDMSEDTEFNEGTAHSIVLPNVFKNTETLCLLEADKPGKIITGSKVWYIEDADNKMGTETKTDGSQKITYNSAGENIYVFNPKDYTELYNENGDLIGAKIKIENFKKTGRYTSDAEDFLKDNLTIKIVSTDESGVTTLVDATPDDPNISYILEKDNNYDFAYKVSESDGHDDDECKGYVTGVYIPINFVDPQVSVLAKDEYIKRIITGTKGTVSYYVLNAKGLMVAMHTASAPTISYHNFGADGAEHVITNGEANLVRLSFVIEGKTYFMNFTIAVNKSGKITQVANGWADDVHNISASILDHVPSNFDSSDLYAAAIVNVTNIPTYSYDAGYILKPKEDVELSTYTDEVQSIQFLSYNYVYEDSVETAPEKLPVLAISNAYYFNESCLWDYEAPITDETRNMFIITSAAEWDDNHIKVGDYVQNITYKNEFQDTADYHLIPGITRVTKKQFIPFNTANSTITYKGKQYGYNGAYDTAKNGANGIYVFTTTEPVLVEYDEKPVASSVDHRGDVSGTIVRQLPISDEVFSHTLRFIPMKGLKITSRHRPGYDAEGNISIEDGISKIYSVIEDAGIHRGLCNQAMVDYRYIIDTMSYGLDSEMGGKVYLSRLAADRGKCTALLNMPSAKQFAVSSNPYFCDSYTAGTHIRPAFDTKYIPEGGNSEMGSSRLFSLPTEDDGAKFTAAFFPHLTYTENGKTIIVPPAADVANVLYRKFTGVNDAYAICANQSGILSNRYLSGLEFDADTLDREYLEPFGVNTIIRDRNQIMIYGNQTAYQTLKSDFNKLHVRENLNTIEIECYEILKQYNFLYNTAATRAAIVQMLTPVLATMQTSGAISSYEIICDETNNTPDIIEADYGIVDLAVWFNHGMEKIVQRITVNRYTSQSE